MGQNASRVLAQDRHHSNSVVIVVAIISFTHGRKNMTNIKLNRIMGSMLTLIGIICIGISSLFIFSTPVFSACSSSVVCLNGSTKECSCAGGGTCTTTSTCVFCTCNGQSPVQSCCQGGDE